MTTGLFQAIIKYLDYHHVNYNVIEHGAVFTSDTAAQVGNHPPEQGTKSLALRGKAGLVVATVAGSERLDFRRIAALLGEKKLSMASPDVLCDALAAEPGGLAPFGYDPPVRLVVSGSLFEVPSVYFNPGRNDRTIRVSGADFRQIMQHQNALTMAADGP